ncbi:DUF7716 domain-containing protein [Snodgrassella alvi]
METLDGASIEDVIDYAKQQSENVSLEDLFKSFMFYYENDAFMDF